jgi:hypothetical protein
LTDGRTSGTHSGLRDVLPGGVCLSPKLSVGGGGQSVATGAEVVRDGAERDQEPLRVLGRLEPLEYPFTLPRRQVRVFSTIVQPLVPTMLTLGQCSTNRGRIAGELVGDHHPRLGTALSIKHPMQETLGSYLIASVLDQDVQNNTVLIDSSPQPVALATDLQRHLIQMPLVASSHSSSTQPCGEGGPECGAPLADGLVADDDPTLGEQILHVAEAEVEAEVQPHGVSDELGREAIASIERPVSGVGDGHQTRLIADPCPT